MNPDKLVEKWKEFLTKKIENSEETSLTQKHINSLDHWILSDSGQLMVPPVIRSNISEQTLKDLFAIR